jgi:hypothetical protein
MRDYGLHRSYPRNHRSNGHYVATAPDVNTRNIVYAYSHRPQSWIRDIRPVNRGMQHHGPCNCHDGLDGSFGISVLVVASRSIVTDRLCKT